MAAEKTITLTTESYVEAVGTLLAVRQLASELAQGLRPTRPDGAARTKPTAGAEAMVNAIDRVLNALDYEPG